MLENGTYKTKAGSMLVLNEKNGGSIRISFNRVEEGACSNCKAGQSPHEFDMDHWRILWYCDYCDGGSSRLYKVDDIEGQEESKQNEVPCVNSACEYWKTNKFDQNCMAEIKDGPYLIHCHKYIPFGL